MKEKEIKAIGKRIKYFRKQAGFTQAKLAEKADVETNNLSRIERGETTPKLQTVLNLANALEITPNDILLESYNAPIEQLDSEIAVLIKEMDAADRKKVIEYIQFVRSEK